MTVSDCSVVCLTDWIVVLMTVVDCIAVVLVTVIVTDVVSVYIESDLVWHLPGFLTIKKEISSLK